MTKVEEARRELWEWIADSSNGEKVIQLADAYGATRALAAHVEACIERCDDRASRDAGFQFHTDCGDGWYCEKGKEIEELGR